MSRAWLFGVPLSGAALLACFSGDSNPQPDAGSALPCDVATTLAPCQACHGSPPTESAPFTLQSYADLTQTSPQYPDQTVAQRVVARMQDPNFPMPPHPLGPTPQADIDTVQAWIDSGYAVPPGTATCAPPTGATDPFATDPVCTNGMYNTQQANVSMFPGEACVSCHVDKGGPKLAFAGTVYPTAHEPNDCKGVLITGAQINVTDSTQKTFTTDVQGNGSFYMYASPQKGGILFTPPYTVKLTYQGRERDMTGLVTPPTDGDCNSCHTETGMNGAPGRILLP
jgi:mono/diheme cytochrome c family protein